MPGAQVRAVEELTYPHSPCVIKGTYFGDSLVMNMQAGSVAMTTTPTPVFLNVLGQKVGVGKVGHWGPQQPRPGSWL